MREGVAVTLVVHSLSSGCGCTCGGDEHHGNVAILDQVPNVGPAFLNLQHSLTGHTVGFQVLARSACAQNAVTQLLQALDDSSHATLIVALQSAPLWARICAHAIQSGRHADQLLASLQSESIQGNTL